MMRKTISFFLLSLLILSLFGCQAQATPAPQPTATIPAVDLADVLAKIKAIEGWSALEDSRLYNHDNLYDLMNGQSDSIFVYGFEQVAVQRFDHSGSAVMVSLFQLDSPASAYGLYTQSNDGEELQLGNEGSGTPGQRITFWQGRYHAQLTAIKPLPAEALLAAAQAVSSALPSGGERPALAGRMPADGSDPVFFHQELSIQDMVYLGGENRLGLDAATNGIVARYALGEGNAWLMLIEYPEPARADSGLKALRSGDYDELLASAANGSILGAVFGEADATAAQTLLEKAMTTK